MNSTCWVTLTSYVKHLERTKKAIIDETEKGWYITWIEKSEEQKEREARDAKKNKMIKNDEELVQMYVNQQIEKAKAELGEDVEEQSEATDLLKGDNETVKLDLKMKQTLLSQSDSKVAVKSVFNNLKDKEKDKDKISDKKDDSKRKISALEEIMEQGKKRQKEEE